MLILGRSSPPTVFKGLGHLNSFIFIINFRIVHFHQNKDWDLTMIALNLWINLVTTGMFTNFSNKNDEFPYLFRSLKIFPLDFEFVFGTEILYIFC